MVGTALGICVGMLVSGFRCNCTLDDPGKYGSGLNDSDEGLKIGASLIVDRRLSALLGVEMLEDIGMFR